MGFRFFRRMQIAPGVRLNLSKSGISPSFGVRGARVTVGRQGIRKTVGIPGTGMFYTEVDQPRRNTKSSRRRAGPAVSQQTQPGLDLGFFKLLFAPKTERAFVNGCKEYVAGHPAKALGELRQCTHLADGAFLAGFLAINTKRFEEAATHLEKAAARHHTLGKYFDKYALQATLFLPITSQITAHITPSRRGALLALAEVYQHQGRAKEALACLKRLRQDTPDDVVVKLSMAELVYDAAANDKRLARQIVQLAGDVQNDSPVHAALMLYKGRALRTLGLNTAARDVLTSAQRKTKDRQADLLQAIRYERACVYQDLGQAKRARREFEKLYAEDPACEDVAARLGLTS